MQALGVISFGHFLFFLHHFLEPEFDFAQFDVGPVVQGIHLSRFEHSPKVFFVIWRSLQLDGLLIEGDSVEEFDMVIFVGVSEVFSIMADIAIVRYDLVSDYFDVLRVEVEQFN